MEHTETNEDIERILAIRFGAMGMIVSTNDGMITDGAILQRDEAMKEVMEVIHSLRQSDKELILGKMEEKKSTEYGCSGRNNGIDTCKSIVEEVMK